MSLRGAADDPKPDAAQDRWVDAGTLPIQLGSNGGNPGEVDEMGPGFMLPDGRVVMIGPAARRPTIPSRRTPGLKGQTIPGGLGV